MKTSKKLAVLLTTCFLFAGCDKIAEKASEKMVEKAIESQAKDGTKASVSLSEGSTKVTTTDASGKSSTMELSSGAASEAEVGVPFYPGAKPQEGGTSKLVTPQGTALTVNLHSSDAVEKVAAFYREKLKAQSQGKSLMDMNSGEGETTLMLADEKAKRSVHVHIAKASPGSDINIVVSQDSGK